MSADLDEVPAGGFSPCNGPTILLDDGVARDATEFDKLLRPSNSFERLLDEIEIWHGYRRGRKRVRPLVTVL